MIDIVHTFRKGIVEIDPEANEKLPVFSFSMEDETKVLYAECGNCGKKAEQDLLASGPGICVMEYACGCVSRRETGKETVWTTSDRNS
tara:strand:- start:29922 stop:30185 length:264 start_codon:yes stop_codon:yes gene_type:complete